MTGIALAVVTDGLGARPVSWQATLVTPGEDDIFIMICWLAVESEFATAVE